MSKILFSILIPTIPSRVNKFFMPLYKKIEKQVGTYTDIEILSVLDNKKRSIGMKRDSLLRLAQGEYIAFVDDDDDISDEYIDSIRTAILTEKNPDVIVFNQIASINDRSFTVRFGTEFENEEAQQDPYDEYVDIVRKPFHVCVWKREIAQKYNFPDCSYGEDWYWAKQVLQDVKTQYRIDKVLHYYRYNDLITEAEKTYPPGYEVNKKKNQNEGL